MFPKFKTVLAVSALTLALASSAFAQDKPKVAFVPHFVFIASTTFCIEASNSARFFFTASDCALAAVPRHIERAMMTAES